MVWIGWMFRGAVFACLLCLPACDRGRLNEASGDASLLVLNPEEPDFIAAAQAADAPHVYLDLQDDRSGPVSVIFVIDYSKDGTPSDDPAIRLTPDNGECNPQILRSYRFSPGITSRPVYSQNIALLDGIRLGNLPELMAIEVTSEMMRRGLIARPEESQPQNVCSRKLWIILLATEGFGRSIFPQFSN